MNFWLSEKKLGNYDKIKNDIISSDFSAKDIRFKIAKYLLLEDFESALEIIPLALKSKSLLPKELKVWPLFKELQTNSKFVKILEKYESKKPAKSKITNSKVAEPRSKLKN